MSHYDPPVSQYDPRCQSQLPEVKTPASLLSIEARKNDFFDFEEKKGLGRLSVFVERIVYSCVKVAFNEAWLRALKWSWASENMAFNQAANQRMQAALSALYSSTASEPSCVAPLSPGMPRQDTIDIRWCYGIIRDVIGVYINHHKGYHMCQKRDISEFSDSVLEFFKIALARAWAAGWSAGVRHGCELFRERERNDATSIMARAEREIADMENSRFEEAADRLFRMTPEQYQAFLDLITPALAEKQQRLNSADAVA